MIKGQCILCGEEFECPTGTELDRVLAEHTRKCPHAEIKEEGEEEWEEKTAAFTTFDEVGDEVQGILIGLDTINLHDKEVRRARLQTNTGNISFLLTTQLEPMIIDIPFGTKVRVRYEGEVKSAAGRKVKTFKVWVLKKK
jgi:hypothetical protein